ncbi:MAG: alpha/beta fold hydrolase [Gemmatimonadetes bacterium]|nr:alpha/beta fold hydrolase [Gemmatimonadota bacterium]
MRKMRLSLFVLSLALFGCETTPLPGEGETVVLAHGLGRTRASMAVLKQRLEWAGYRVESVAYDSRGASFPEQVTTLAAAVERCCAEVPVIHFVGHSLGGLVIRGYLGDNRPAGLGRVVMLAPPNQGSLFVEWLGEVPGGTEALGPVGATLGTGSTDLPATLPPPDYEMGIIAGTRSVHPIGPIAIPGPDDGIVSVEQARVEGVPMLVLPRSHYLIMNSRHTAEAVIRFLRTGSFEGAGQAVG